MCVRLSDPAHGCEIPEDWQDTTTGAPVLCEEIEKMFGLEVRKIQLREIVGRVPRPQDLGVCHHLPRCHLVMWSLGFFFGANVTIPTTSN